MLDNKFYSYQKDTYKDLILLISHNIQNESDKEFVLNNIDNLSTEFIRLSDYTNKLSSIISGEKSDKVKLQLLQHKLKLNKTQSDKVLNTNLFHKLPTDYIRHLEQHGGNSNGNIHRLLNTCVYNLPKLTYGILIQFPTIVKGVVSNYLTMLSNIFTSEWEDFNDFQKPLDSIYIILFLCASMPITGSISDFIIVCKALHDNNLFLAYITITYGFISFLTWGLFNMGPLIKFLYFLDNYSFINYSKKNNIMVRGKLSRLVTESNQKS